VIKQADTSPASSSPWVKALTPQISVPLLFLGAILGLALASRLWYGSFIIDDAYITFRYARNLAEGLGLVYNPDGQRVLGTTTPLFTLLLALFNLSGLSLEGVSLWLSIFSDWATIGLLYGLGRRLNAPGIGLMAGMLVALWPDYLNYAVSGMETSLYTALLLGSLYLYVRRSYSLSGLLLALLVLTRPDGLLMVIALFGHYLLRERRLPWHMALAFAPLPLLWAAFATFYFGSPVSQSLVSKAAGVDATPAESFLQLLIFLNQSSKPILTVLAALGIFTILRGQAYKFLRLPLAWWLLYCVAFISQGAFHLFPWYYIPLLPFYFMFAATGLIGLSKPLAQFVQTGRGRLLARGGVGILAGLAIYGLFALVGNNKTELAESQSGREVLYREVASRLRPQLGPNEQIATKEIGTIGYFCRCQIYDLAGLVTPEVLKQPELTLLQKTRPAFILTYNNLLKPATLESEWLHQNYEKAEVHPVQICGQQEFYVFRRTN